jgi:hypothetical protein
MVKTWDGIGGSPEVVVGLDHIAAQLQRPPTPDE